MKTLSKETIRTLSLNKNKKNRKKKKKKKIKIFEGDYNTNKIEAFQ